MPNRIDFLWVLDVFFRFWQKGAILYYLFGEFLVEKVPYSIVLFFGCLGVLVFTLWAAGEININYLMDIDI